ncbi:hypothetical protein SRB5_49800 [Streptomyces sp. RB5]|uniref:Uncharacterized protein n=1 Tax=Streptomyces smaragdinus TaxID=2585196 RepID=A0A7K0CPY1_9ACTN|nr:hypothetical protein [Streptomyces smaragdinus]MQY14804.1 hypothetical protein [Streptomyces smaragdinus]
MHVETAAALLAGVTAVRVFGPDLRRLCRRALGAGVRAGAVELARRSLEPPAAVPWTEAP